MPLLSGFPRRVITVVILITLLCWGPEPLRKVPLNFTLLGLFTLAEALMVSTIASYYDSKGMLLCVGMLVVSVSGLVLFATQVWPGVPSCAVCSVQVCACVCPLQTKYDFTNLTGVLGSFWCARCQRLSLVDACRERVCAPVQPGSRLLRTGANLLERCTCRVFNCAVHT